LLNTKPDKESEQNLPIDRQAPFQSPAYRENHLVIANERPEFGELREVVSGVYCLKMPIPFVLDHINLWLLKDVEGWVIIDTGFYSEAAISIWQKILNTLRMEGSIHKILVTHFHPDHVGMAQWLIKQTSADFLMSQQEFMAAQTAYNPLSDEQIGLRRTFLEQMGLSTDQVSCLLKRKSGSTENDRSIPDIYQCIEGGDELQVNGESWTLYSFSGHSPEHICLYNAQRKILIAGDQVLPAISPNISVSFTEPEADPLAGYLRSLSVLSTLDKEVLVLPAHGGVFTGLRERAKILIEGHRKDLDKVLVFCQQTRNVKEVMEEMFGDKLSILNLFLASGEALAHLNYLVAKGKIKRDKANVYRYTTLS